MGRQTVKAPQRKIATEQSKQEQTKLKERPEEAHKENQHEVNEKTIASNKTQKLWETTHFNNFNFFMPQCASQKPCSAHKGA
eukprot:5729098-Amphidinium_carterae.1